MAKMRVHEKDCMAHLDKPMTEVHAWLDEFAAVYDIRKYLDYHRSFRHNVDGVLYCWDRWGKDGLRAAMLHLVRDWYMTIALGEYDWKKVMDLAILALDEFEQRKDCLCLEI